MSILNSLTLYGFDTVSANAVWYGYGSLVSGVTIRVEQVGNLFRINGHRWLYDSYGELVADTYIQRLVPAGLVWGIVLQLRKI